MAAQVTVEILNRTLVCRQEGRFAAWPSITRTRAGELCVVFSGDRMAHVDPFGKNFLVRSRDGGQSWGTPELVNDSPLDDRDAGIIQTSRGTLLLFYFTSRVFADWADWQEELRRHYGDQAVALWRPAMDGVEDAVRRGHLGSFVRRSEDGGASWGPPADTLVSAPHGGIELADGRLLYVGNMEEDGRQVIGCVQSTDDGRSWQLLSVLCPVDIYDHVRFHEPHLTETVDGRILVQLRANAALAADRTLYQCQSVDKGRSWTAPADTGIWGLPPHLVRHPSAVLVTVYGHRRPPYGQRASFSLDGGVSWQDEATLALVDFQAWQAPRDVRDAAAPRHDYFYQVPDLGYPCSTLLADGSLCTVYYETPSPQEGAVIRAVNWKFSLSGGPLADRTLSWKKLP